MEQQVKKRPSAAWYTIPVVLGILFGIGVTLFVNGVKAFISEMPAFMLADEGSQQVLEVKDSGRYYVFHEYSGRRIPEGSVEFLLTNTETGKVYVSQKNTMNANYSMNGVKLRAIAQVQLDAGQYIPGSSYNDAQNEIFYLDTGARIYKFMIGIVAFVFSIFAFFGAIISLVIIIVIRQKKPQQPFVPPYQNPPYSPQA